MDLNIFQLLTHENIIFFAILSCGLYTGYTDFRYRKIANIYTLFLIGAGMSSQVLFISQGSITWIHSCINLFGGLGISFVMFYLGVWAAGDAKLFWGISLLMPPEVFSRAVETQFYPLILLINIFLVFLIYIALKCLFKMPLPEQRKLISVSFIAQLKGFPRRILQVLSHIGVGGLAFYIPAQLGVELDLAVRVTCFVAIVFAFNKIVETYIPENYQVVFHIIFVLLAIFLVIPSLIDLGILILFVFLISLFLLIFSSFIHSLFTKATQITDLKPNMIPAERIIEIKEEQGFDKYVKLPASFANPAQDNIIVDVSSEGLTDEQIANLRRLARQGRLQGFENSLLIQEKIPFAFMIVIGALVNFLAKGMVQNAELSQMVESIRLIFSSVPF